MQKMPHPKPKNAFCRRTGLYIPPSITPFLYLYPSCFIQKPAALRIVQNGGFPVPVHFILARNIHLPSRRALINTK